MIVYSVPTNAHVSAFDRQSVSRRYSYPLRAGHRAAYLCTETTMYRYFMELQAPKEWFKANVDAVLALYGAKYAIQKEDLYFGESHFLTFPFFCVDVFSDSYRNARVPRLCAFREPSTPRWPGLFPSSLLS